MKTVCLSTAYLAPVSYYCQLMAYDKALVEQHENYVKQTYRNRANIATAGGVMPLTIPVEHAKGEKTPVRDLRISDHGNWRHLHWQALKSAYDRSPFFEYYADDFRPFYEDRKLRYLLDFNMELQELICSLINLTPNVELTEAYQSEGQFVDLRNAISPKTRTAYNIYKERDFRPYCQVFARQHGFLPDMSIADLLFNMGPESLLVLRDEMAR